VPSERSLLIERIRDLADEGTRFHDMAFRFRVIKERLGNGSMVLGELRPRVYGGRYDSWAKRYVGEAEQVGEILITPGQIEFAEFDEPGVIHLLAIGPPGGGKTMAAVVRICRCLAEWPHQTGGVMAPVRDSAEIVLDKLLDTIGPLGWIKGNPRRDRILQVTCVNDARVIFRGAQKATKSRGATNQGHDWAWAVNDEQQDQSDEALRETLFRGRRAGTKYRMYSTLTNQARAAVQQRIANSKQNPAHRVIAFSAKSNTAIEGAWWEVHKSELSPEDYRRFILNEDVPYEGLIYPRFTQALVRPVPPGMRDVTTEVIAAKFPYLTDGEVKRLGAGQDWGTKAQATEFVRCLEDQHGHRSWWVRGEVVSSGGVGTDRHAQQVIRWLGANGYTPGQVLIQADPHIYKDASDGADKSDYDTFRKAGLTTRKASSQQINRRNRFAMINALLEDANGVHRLFIERLPSGLPAAPRLVESFTTYSYGANGEPEQFNKDARDVSHSTDALGYWLWAFERIRGGHVFGSKSSGADEDDGQPMLGTLSREEDRRLTRRLAYQ
jgi:hypothetical protein